VNHRLGLSSVDPCVIIFSCGWFWKAGLVPVLISVRDQMADCLHRAGLPHRLFHKALMTMGFVYGTKAYMHKSHKRLFCIA
jgi:hypothetical protein